MNARQFIQGGSTLPSTAPLVAWVGAPYGDGSCWRLVRDAFARVAGLDLPENFYDATQFLDTARDVRSQGWSDFTPHPWDIVMLISKDRLPFIPLHSGIALDSERFLHSWGRVDVVITRFDDPEFRRRIAGFVRLYRRP